MNAHSNLGASQKDFIYSHSVDDDENLQVLQPLEIMTLGCMRYELKV